MINKNSIYYILGIGVAVLLSACSAPPQQSNNLILNVGAEPTYLNPVLSTDSASSSVNGFVFNGLMKVSPSLDMIPDLAKSYKISKDGKTYTFYLHENIKWHDGTPFSAHDVKFTFDKILDKTTNTVRRSNFIISGKPIQFNVINNDTFQAKLPQPFSPFLIHMGMGILPKHILNNKDINKDIFNRQPIGTGPYKFSDWKSGQFIRLSKNPQYFGGPIKMDGVLLKIIPDERTALIALKKGEIDQAGIPNKDYIKLKSHQRINTYNYEDLLYTYMGFNLKHKHFSNVNVRRAIAHAINKENIVKGVLKGYGQVADIPSSPVSWAYPHNRAFTTYPYNPETSKKLLKKEGYVMNPSTKILEKNGDPFEFTMITNKGNKDREKTAQLIQRYLEVIGIKMHIQLMEWSSFIKIVNANKDPKQFDAVILGWSLGLDPDAYSIWHSSQYPKGFNFIGYQNKMVDRLIQKGRTLTQKTKRTNVYHSLYKQISQDVPYVFLYYPKVLTGINKRIKGLSDPGPAGLMNPIENIYIEK